MKIPPRSKFVYTAIVFILIGLTIGGLLIETQKTILAVIFFVWIVVGSWALSSIRCPNCGTSVAFQGKVGGVSLYAGFVRRTCQNCGHDLAASDPGPQ